MLAARKVEKLTGMVVRLVVLDTLARCIGGSDENAAHGMGAFIHGCDYIKAKTHITVLVIHYSGQDLVHRCTEMNDAEEPPYRAYALSRVPSYTYDDEERIVSLMLNDGRSFPRGGQSGPGPLPGLGTSLNK